MIISLETKIKDKIMNEFNEDLYRKLNMTLSDANELYGWGFGYMYKIMNRVFKNYGPIGLKRETKYIPPGICPWRDDSNRWAPQVHQRHPTNAPTI